MLSVQSGHSACMTAGITCKFCFPSSKKLLEHCNYCRSWLSLGSFFVSFEFFVSLERFLLSLENFLLSLESFRLSLENFLLSFEKNLNVNSIRDRFESRRDICSQSVDSKVSHLIFMELHSREMALYKERLTKNISKDCITYVINIYPSLRCSPMSQVFLDRVHWCMYIDRESPAVKCIADIK